MAGFLLPEIVDFLTFKRQRLNTLQGWGKPPRVVVPSKGSGIFT